MPHTIRPIEADLGTALRDPRAAIRIVRGTPDLVPWADGCHPAVAS